MEEKPILFKAEMVRAILAGDKTQTRRVIKPQPEKIGIKKDAWIFQGEPYLSDYALECDLDSWRDVKSKCFKVGDNLWVRETFGYKYPQDKTGIVYKADRTHLINRWKPSIFMPRVASRITLEVVNVGVERVQSITETDARAEGVESKPTFKTLWDSINTKRGYGWESNPWVFVYEFKTIEPLHILQ